MTFTLDKNVIKGILNRTPPENKMFFFDGSIAELNTDAFVTSDCDDFKYISFENRNRNYDLPAIKADILFKQCKNRKK